jgi:hypothetical protein
MIKPKQPFWIGDHHFKPEFETKNLLEKLYVHPDLISDYIYNNFATEEEREKAEAEVNEWWYHTDVLSLQEIMDVLPPNTNPKDVIISVHRDRHITDITITVSLRSSINEAEWQKAHDAEKADYEKRFLQYEKEMKKYELWETEQKIKELEKKRDNLKK